MNVKKKTIARLTKCYSIAPLRYRGRPHFLVAAEKADPCLLFDEQGNRVDVVWTAPGGTMSMVQVPGTDGQFLATHQFYSPNDSAQAKIVLVTPGEAGGWRVRTLCRLPFVHRFDILERGGVRYLIACTLKSGHAHKDDWSQPGKVWAAVLPEDLSGFDEAHPLELTVLREGLTKNHGYYRTPENGVETALISAQEGVFQFFPPERPGAPWEIRQLLDVPASDAVLVDLDGDGQRELTVLSPFHGDTIRIYHRQGEVFVPVYTFPEPAPFCHAIWGGTLCGEPAVVIGHRQGKRNLMAFTYDRREVGGGYRVHVLDRDCGSANVAHFRQEEREFLVSANRETDEVALYELSP